jgi:hypothetical protein
MLLTSLRVMTSNDERIHRSVFPSREVETLGDLVWLRSSLSLSLSLSGVLSLVTDNRSVPVRTRNVT